MVPKLEEERRQRGRLRRLQRQQAAPSKALDFPGMVRELRGKDAHPNRSEHAGWHPSTALTALQKHCGHSLPVEAFTKWTEEHAGQTSGR